MPLTIIGVAPKDFLGFSISIEHDVTVPIALLPSLMAVGSHDDPRHVALGQHDRPAARRACPSSRRARRSRRCGRRCSTRPCRRQFLTTQREDYLKWTRTGRAPRRPASNAACAAATPTRSTRSSALRRWCCVIAAANLCALVFARAEVAAAGAGREARARIEPRGA